MSLQQVWWINWQHLCAQKQWTTTSTLTITTTWRSQNVSSVSACQQQQGSKWCLIWWWCLLIWIMVQAMSCVPSWICKLNRVCVHNGVNNDFSDLFCRSRVQKLPKAALKDNTTISESELWSTYFDPVLSCLVSDPDKLVHLRWTNKLTTEGGKPRPDAVISEWNNLNMQGQWNTVKLKWVKGTPASSYFVKISCALPSSTKMQ